MQKFWFINIKNHDCFLLFFVINLIHSCRLQIHHAMPSTRLILREEDVVRLALEFLHNRELHISQLSLERETGVINGCYSDDILFLRQLILDGQWDDVLEFIQPLEALQAFDIRKFSYSILKHKYVELLCIKSEANMQVRWFTYYFIRDEASHTHLCTYTYVLPMCSREL